MQTQILKIEWQLVLVHFLQGNASVLQLLQYPFRKNFTVTSLSIDHEVIWSERYVPPSRLCLYLIICPVRHQSEVH